MSQLPDSALHLPDAYFRDIKKLLQQKLPNAEVWAYGSRVKGGSHASSDLDLVARQKGKLKNVPLDLSSIRKALVESHLPIQIQMIDWASVPETFHAEIEKAYVVIQ